jgi:hypothetical protein
MNPMLLKSQLILEHEKRFIRALALKVLDKPLLQIWMIFIPIIFVYYFFEWQKYKKCNTSFNEQYICNFKYALDKAAVLVQDGTEPDLDTLAKMQEIPAGAQKKLTELYSVLVEHYEVLLRASGSDYQSLVRSAYKKHANYLLFVNQLNNAEKKFNAALRIQLEPVIEDANDIICAIERFSEIIRRNDAEEIFS